MTESLSHSNVLMSHACGVRGIHLSPCGKKLVVSDVDRFLHLYEEQRGAWTKVAEKDLAHPSDRFRALDMIRDVQFCGERLYVASGESLRCLNAHDLEHQWESVSEMDWAFMITTPDCLAVSDKGSLACSYADGTMEVYGSDDLNRSDPRPTLRWRDEDAPVVMEFAGDLLYGTNRYSLSIWDTFLGVKRRHRKWEEKVFYQAVDAELNRIAVRTLWTLRVYDLTTFRVVGETHAAMGLPKVAVRPNHAGFLSLDAGGLSFVSPDGVLEKYVALAPDAHALCLAVSGSTIYVGDSAGRVVVLDA